jgi:hypothetical protein
MTYLKVVVAIVALASSTARAQGVGPREGVSNAPPSPSSGSILGPGAHDAPPRAMPSHNAQLTPGQCESFLNDWPSLPSSRQTSLAETKTRCDAIAGKPALEKK